MRADISAKHMPPLPLSFSRFSLHAFDISPFVDAAFAMIDYLRFRRRHLSPASPARFADITPLMPRQR